MSDDLIDDKQERLAKVLGKLEELAPRLRERPEPDRTHILLSLGDHLVELVQLNDGKRAVLRTVAERLGISYSLAHQAHWVSSKVPIGDPARAGQLTYSAVRALAAAPKEARQSLLADPVSPAEATSSRQLLTRVQQERQQRSTVAGRRCVHCKEVIKAGAAMVSFRIRGKKRSQECCSLGCAVSHFKALAQPETAPRSE